jgi:hypothetical protein
MRTKAKITRDTFAVIGNMKAREVCRLSWCNSKTFLFMYLVDFEVAAIWLRLRDVTANS